MITEYINAFITMFIILGTVPNIFVFESIFDSIGLDLDKKDM
jgi:hypothetical protein